MTGGGEDPRELVDPTTGRPVLMAPIRQRRPMQTDPAAAAGPCPFCAGNEAMTPPTVAAVPGGTAGAWTARAFANKYPAHPHHEVIAEGAAHTEQPCDLPAAVWRDVVALWQQRLRALEARPDVGCAFLFKNTGALAGASIAHNHSQLLGLRVPPPRLLLEHECARALPRCPWCATLATATDEGRVVYANQSHVVFAPEPPKLPNETWLLPRRCDDDFLTTDAGGLADALHALFTATARALDRPAFNFWLHRLPRARFHWHFELQPRTGQMAGLELGGDMYINSIPAATAAARLRQGLLP
ncbi:MAG: DUF4921 family protein [Planctomycetota bacterium]